MNISVLLTCNISACGVWTKYETLPFGADCKHSWPSVATGLYMNTMAFDNLPSYRTCVCVRVFWLWRALLLLFLVVDGGGVVVVH